MAGSTICPWSKAQRLVRQPVTPEQWTAICAMGNTQKLRPYAKDCDMKNARLAKRAFHNSIH